MKTTPVKIIYPMEGVVMKNLDSKIPVIPKSAVIVNEEIMLVQQGLGMIVLLDARVKKYLFMVQNRVDKLELWGTLSLKTGQNGGTKYVVFHPCNMALLEAVVFSS